MRIVFIILIIAIGLVWFLLPSDQVPNSMEAQSHMSSEPSGPEPERIDQAKLDSKPLQAADTTARTLVEESATTEVIEDESAVFGLVLDADTMRPIPGARIDLSRPLHKEFNSLDLARFRDSLPVQSEVSDGAGRFRLHAPSDVPLDMTVRSMGYATVQRGFVFTGNESTVLMRPGAVFEGRITLKSTDSPVSGVKLYGWDKTRTIAFEGETDNGGNFRFEGLAASMVTIIVEPREHAAPDWKTLEFAAGQTLRKDFALEDGVTIHGVVTDKKTGLPITGAEVGEGWIFRKVAITDAQGRYQMHGFGGPGIFEVHVRAPGYGKSMGTPGSSSNRLPTTDTELNFALLPAMGAHGQVVDSQGSPIPGVYCAAIAYEHRGREQLHDYESCDSDDNGRFAFSSLNPSLSHQISLRHPGYGTRTYDFPDTTGNVDLGTLILHRSGAIRGSVENTKGQPLPNTRVSLSGTNMDVSALRPNSVKSHTTSYSSDRESKTDSAGRFHFADVADGSYVLQASFRGNRLVSERQSVVLEIGKTSDDTILVLDMGSSLTGKVVGPDNQPLLDAIIRAWPISGESSQASSTRTGAKGEFRIAGLEEGEYLLRIDVRYLNLRGPTAPLASTAPLRASTGASDLTLYTVEAAPLRIKLLNAQGQVQSESYVRALEAGTQVVVDSGWSDDDGNLTLHVRPEEGFDILWMPSRVPFGSTRSAES